MIESFKDKATARVWKREYVKQFSPTMQRVAYRKLVMIHRSRDVNDLRIPPGNRLEMLKGDRLGHYSVRINEQWRICFRWENGSAYDVEIVDYH